MNAMLPFIMEQRLGISASIYGWLTIATGAGYLSGAFAGGRLSAKIGAKKVVLLGIFIEIVAMVLGYLVALYSFDVVSVLLPLVLMIFGVGLIIPIASSFGDGAFSQNGG